MKTDKVVLFLIGLILLAFASGAWQVNRQARAINQLIVDQSPLIFSFDNPNGGVFIVTCVRIPSKSTYICKTEGVN